DHHDPPQLRARVRQLRSRQHDPGRGDRTRQDDLGDLRRGAQRAGRRGVPSRSSGYESSRGRRRPCRSGGRSSRGRSSRGRSSRRRRHRRLAPMGRYAIGVDFGTESGRGLLLDLDSGAELAVEVVPYAHGVIDRELPSTGERLPPDWALQDPDDWVAVIEQAIPVLLEESGITPTDVVGIGVDFTSCTVLPTTSAGEPLRRYERWRVRRHAWPKLWKHHSAQPVADRLNEV